MFSSLIIDLIVFKENCGECLGEMVSEWYKEKAEMLLYFVVEHLQDVQLLQHRFYCFRGQL